MTCFIKYPNQLFLKKLEKIALKIHYVICIGAIAFMILAGLAICILVIFGIIYKLS